MIRALEQARLLFRVGRAWAKVPGWRLGQLVANAAADLGADDPFFAEDEHLVAAVERAAEGSRQR